LEGRIKQFKNGKGYVLTKDNFIKIIRITRKALLRIPIIICGETGCGKTHLVDFVASCLIADEFRCFTLNAGTTQAQIIARLESYVELAGNLQGKNHFGKDE
jgi:midasin (ATPase involved in ribosome maturation)